MPKNTVQLLLAWMLVLTSTLYAHAVNTAPAFSADHGLALNGENIQVLTDSKLTRAHTKISQMPELAASAYAKDTILTARSQFKPGDEFLDCDLCPNMVVVPAGSFMMGSPKNEKYRDPDEGPRHKVHIPNPFAVGKFEVTKAQFKTFVRATGHDASIKCLAWDGKKWDLGAGRNFHDPGFSQSDAHPAACVSWNDAKAYVSWLSRKTEKTYRLLSEAEWEFAARAGTTTRFYFGDSADDICGYGNGADRVMKQHVKGTEDWAVAPCADGHAYTAPAGSFAANALGLHDMHGNVWEWVEDCYSETYQDAPVNGTARISENCARHVMRSGSWVNEPGILRSAVRYGVEGRNDYGGFRVARTL